MSASATGQKKQCVICNKSGGILICDGCQKTFCGKHVVDHRQELGLKLDQLMQDYDVLYHQFNDVPLPLRQIDLFALIDQWENAAIRTIKQAADMARETLQSFHEENKDQTKMKMDNLSTVLRSAREADDFAEPDLNHWTNKLKEIQLEIHRPASVAITKSKTLSIELIEVTTKAAAAAAAAPLNVPRVIRNRSEGFREKFGSILIDDNRSLATHIGNVKSYAYIRRDFNYTNNRFGVRFRLENFVKPYQIFFGCISSKSKLQEETLRSLGVVGWFGFNQVYEHGHCTTDCRKYGYFSERNQPKDILTLTFDVRTKHVQLFNERTKQMNTLEVNEQLMVMPCEFLVILTNPGDSVRLMPFQ